jgi:hypothetical protein
VGALKTHSSKGAGDSLPQPRPLALLTIVIPARNGQPLPFHLSLCLAGEILQPWDYRKKKMMPTDLKFPTQK